MPCSAYDLYLILFSRNWSQEVPRGVLLRFVEFPLGCCWEPHEEQLVKTVPMAVPWVLPRFVEWSGGDHLVLEPQVVPSFAEASWP